jgi:hypothetical protein
MDFLVRGEGPAFPDEVSFRVSGGKGREPNVGSADTAISVRERMPKTLWACAEGLKEDIHPPRPPKKRARSFFLGAIVLLQLHGLLPPLSAPPLLLGGGIPGRDRPHPAPPAEDHEEDPLPSAYEV